MPIDRKKKILFVHVPKNAGTSITKIFDFKKGVKNLTGFEEKTRIHFSHLTIGQIKNFINLKKYYSFAFVRNPFDKIVSEFFYRKLHKDKNVNYFKRLKVKKFTFDEFVNRLSEFKITNRINKSLEESHFLTQTKFLYIRNKLYVDFVGRIENFENDFKKLVEKINEKRNLNINIDKIHHSNSSKHVNYKFYYNSTTKKIIEKIYKKDLDNFNYVF